MQQQLPNVRGIQTAPTFVESTSMVLVYGLDLFFTRVTPSQTFDLLNDEFQYLPLVCICFPLQICLLKLGTLYLNRWQPLLYLLCSPSSPVGWYRERTLHDAGVKVERVA